VPWPSRQPICPEPNTHAGGGPTTSTTNTITILYPSPPSHNSATADVETGPKLIKHREGEPLHEDVGELRCRQDMKDTDLTDGNLLSDKMKINLHILRALMLNRVCANIVAVDKCAPRRRGLELVEQLTQPSGRSHAVGNGTILGLSAGAGDNGLPLGRPGNQVIPQEHRIA
jgi:hypothetical protein